MQLRHCQEAWTQAHQLHTKHCIVQRYTGPDWYSHCIWQGTIILVSVCTSVVMLFHSVLFFSLGRLVCRDSEYPKHKSMWPLNESLWQQWPISYFLMQFPWWNSYQVITAASHRCHKLAMGPNMLPSDITFGHTAMWCPQEHEFFQYTRTIGFRGCKAWAQGESVMAMCMVKSNLNYHKHIPIHLPF